MYKINFLEKLNELKRLNLNSYEYVITVGGPLANRNLREANDKDLKDIQLIEQYSLKD